MTRNHAEPPYPETRRGTSRLDDAATMRAALRYWLAVRAHARAEGDGPRARTAESLARSFRDRLRDNAGGLGPTDEGAGAGPTSSSGIPDRAAADVEVHASEM